MTCKGNICGGKCVSPWACGWKDNFSQSATVENGIETDMQITMIDPPVSRRWLWQIGVTVAAIAAAAIWAWLR